MWCYLRPVYTVNQWPHSIIALVGTFGQRTMSNRKESNLNEFVDVCEERQTKKKANCMSLWMLLRRTNNEEHQI